MKSLIVSTLSFFSFIFANSANMDSAISLYDRRAENAIGLIADSKIIDKAIVMFTNEMKNSDSELDAGVYLLRCYYYKGKFCVKDDDKRKNIYNEGKLLGEKLIQVYSESVAAHYWYLVNLGSWAEIYGILSAAKEGVANTMREYSQKIISIDPNYSDGGGYFMLGAVHLKSPYIPFILSWPNNEKALNYLTLAYEMGDSTPSQTVYLARALYKNDEKDKAISLLSSLIEEPISESYKLEDLDQHEIGKKQLGEWR